MLKIAVIMSMLSLISCAQTESSGGSTSSGGSSTSNEVFFTLEWSPPTLFENNATLDANNDLLEYRIYYSNDVNNITSNVEVLSPSKRTFSTKLLKKENVSSSSDIHIAMTSVSKDGVESILSQIISFTPDNPI